MDVMQEEEAVSRSLWWTLSAAVFSYALLVSTSWKMGVLHGANSNEPLLGRVAWHAIDTFLLPFRAVYHLVNQSMSLILVKGSYLSKGMPLFPYLDVAMAHLTLSSTLLVEAPASQDPGPHLRRYLVPVESVASLRPVELTPLYVPNLWGDDTDQTAHPHEEDKLYLRLPTPIFFMDESLQEREALLMCGFTALPEISQLSAMDETARLSRLWALAVVLQAGGYTLGVTERWKRGMGVSPVEAILCVFSVPILIQMLLQPPAARLNYERPLLLRLRAPQFTMFRDLPRQLDRENAHNGHVSLLFLNLAYLGCSYLLYPTVTLYYSFQYWHLCSSCSLATLLLFLLFTYTFFAPTLMSLVASKYNLGQDLQALIVGGPQMEAVINIGELLFGVGPICVFFLSVILAFWSTITHWESFDVPTNPKFAWLLPHLAT